MYLSQLVSCYYRYLFMCVCVCIYFIELTISSGYYSDIWIKLFLFESSFFLVSNLKFFKLIIETKKKSNWHVKFKKQRHQIEYNQVGQRAAANMSQWTRWHSPESISRRHTQPDGAQANQLDQPAEIKRLRVHLRKHLQHGTHRYIDTQFLLIGQC